MADDEAEGTGSEKAAEAAKADVKKKGKLGGNLVPALIIGAALFLGPKLAGGGSDAALDEGATTTEAHAADDGAAGDDHATATTVGEPSHGEDAADDAAGHAGSDATGDAADTGDHSTGSGAVVTASHGSSGEVHWAYEGEGGPDHWGELSGDYTACVDGSKQSPIDIRNPLPMGLTDIGFEYLPMDAAVVNNGHTIQANFEPGSRIRIDGKVFELAQFHLHAPSEHTMAGKRFPMELHLVHKSADGELAVVGVFFVEGSENQALAPLFAAMPTEANDTARTPRPIELAALLPLTRVDVRYYGSLTTPPCSEGVRWNVLSDPVEASAEQLKAFQALYKGNNRPLQPVNNRTVVVDADPAP